MSAPRLAVALLAAAVLVLPSGAAAYAPAASATVTPGVMTLTAGGQCTANFVYTAGGKTYLGQAAHCSSTGAQTDTDGCESGSLPLGTRVDIGPGAASGRLAYNSWLAMQAAGETDDETCAFNDFALIEIDPADVGKVNPSVPKFGGPTRVGGASRMLATVFSYGNSSLRQGITLLSPKQGTVLSTSPGGWSRNVLTVTPGVPGDSGSGFLDAGGAAIGTLSTLALLPIPGSNGVGDLGRELAYASSHGIPGLELVPGTEPFRGSLL
ncbi:MAG: serine protease [Solirubrobacterales bacterium]|nr:serine protease [Solirubrobacterales bacterium]